MSRPLSIRQESVRAPSAALIRARRCCRLRLKTVRFGGIPAEADITQEAMSTAVRAARLASVGPMIADGGLLVRMPISGDLITHIVNEGYDARDAADTSRAAAPVPHCASWVPHSLPAMQRASPRHSSRVLATSRPRSSALSPTGRTHGCPIPDDLRVCRAMSTAAMLSGDRRQRAIIRVRLVPGATGRFPFPASDWPVVRLPVRRSW